MTVETYELLLDISRTETARAADQLARLDDRLYATAALAATVVGVALGTGSRQSWLMLGAVLGSGCLVCCLLGALWAHPPSVDVEALAARAPGASRPWMVNLALTRYRDVAGPHGLLVQQKRQMLLGAGGLLAASLFATGAGIVSARSTDEVPRCPTLHATPGRASFGPGGETVVRLCR